LSTILRKPSPAKAAARSNLHRAKRSPLSRAFVLRRLSDAGPLYWVDRSRRAGIRNPCVDGPRLARICCSRDGSGRLRSCVRPWCAAMSTAGPDGLRGSGPKHHGGVYAPKGFPGCSDPRFDRSPSCCCPCKRQVRTRVSELLRLGQKPPAINLTTHHHSPECPSHLVGQRDCRKLLRLAR